MLGKDKLEEIKEHLERARNPVFFYDNDADGLCSYVILRRALGRGYGVADGYGRQPQFRAQCRRVPPAV